MDPVGPEDEPSEFREPPSPDDRLWRHPSELALGGPGAHPLLGGPLPADGRRRQRERSPTWAVAGVSALVAGLVSAGLVVAVVGTRTLSSSSDVAFERQMVRPRTASTVSTSPVVDMAERLRPAIVQLKVQTPGHAATASGVIFRSDGHLLTSAHVVEGATSIRVGMSNGREVVARLVGTDPETDTAVVKLDGGPFPVATLGSAMDLRVGQTAVAIGFPLGLAGGPSVTGGMISALHRQITLNAPATTSRPTLVDMIQIDAPVSAGSSGGALLDTNGAVIGITTAVTPGDAGASPSDATAAATSGGDGSSFGFATAIDVARSVADELIRTGKVVHSWLGVEGGDLDVTTAVDLNLDGGAMVGQVTEGSPAERGGLAPGDVIVGVAGRTVTSMGELVMALRSHPPGGTVALKVIRDHQGRTVTVTLVERPVPS